MHSGSAPIAKALGDMKNASAVRKKKDEEMKRCWKLSLDPVCKHGFAISSRSILQLRMEVNSWKAVELNRKGTAQTAITSSYPSANKHNGCEEAVATCQKSTGS